MSKTRRIGKFVGTLNCSHFYWTDLDPHYTNPMRVCKRCGTVMCLQETKIVGDKYWTDAVNTQKLGKVQL